MAAAVRRGVVLLSGLGGEPEDLPLDPRLAVLQPLERGPVPLPGVHGCAPRVPRPVDQAGDLGPGVAGVAEEAADGEQVLARGFLLLRDGVAGVADLVLPVRERGLGGLVGRQRLVLAAQDHAAGGVGEQQLLDRARRRDRVHHGQLCVVPGLHPEHGAAEQLALQGDVEASSAQLGRDAVEPVLGAHERAGETEPLGTGVPELASYPLQPVPGVAQLVRRPLEPAGRPRDGTAGFLQVVVLLVDLVLTWLRLSRRSSSSSANAWGIAKLPIATAPTTSAATRWLRDGRSDRGGQSDGAPGKERTGATNRSGK